LRDGEHRLTGDPSINYFGLHLRHLRINKAVKNEFDTIVIGCGGIGSAALYWLARELGGEVLGLEQFAIGHSNGSSQDHSRIIRRSYHTPEYTALAAHAYEAWDVIEAEAGEQLVLKTGGLDLGPVDGLVNDYLASMRQEQIAHEELDPGEIRRRWPQWQVDSDVKGVFQPDAGIVDAARGLSAHARLARARGAQILENQPVTGIHPRPDGVEVTTAATTYSCRALVMAGGGWTSKLMALLGKRLPITVTQEQVTYFATPDLAAFAPKRFPIWIWHERECFYGFPVYGEPGCKVAQDLGGREVTVDTRTFDPDPAALARVEAFLRQYLPSALGPILYTKTCLYTLAPDRNFILDTLPEYPQISMVIGCGHAYKFASLIGKILCQFAQRGDTEYVIPMCRLDRPAITDPNFPRAFFT
jgi:sarcosine oxidase